MSKHETRLQDHPVCPHCGYRHDDAWEWNFGPGLDGDRNDIECGYCGETFDCERVVYTNYTTKPSKPKEQA
jgi:diadenosine tetraphosphatase ApaH/serine/threonine PP2A family protein phosphatase